MNDKNELCKPEIKICGLTSKAEVGWVVTENADYAGFVMYFPKSKRNLSETEAESLLKELWLQKKKQNSAIPKSVAVVVSPTIEQVKKIIRLGFDFMQIHGTIESNVVDEITIPVIRAINVGSNLVQENGKVVTEWLYEQITKEKQFFNGKLIACLYDAKEPGSGKVFDWQILSKIKRGEEKLILAGGLCADNVVAGIRAVHPDIVDVSSGVEISQDLVGKDYNKIREFIRKVRTNE